MSQIFNNSGASITHRVMKPFKENSIFRILPYNLLLASARRQKIIADIKQAAALPNDEYFEKLYLALINKFVEFVQILPVNNEARLASLMDEGLLRGLYVLELQKQAAEEEPDYLMSYVLFSAALLLDVGCVVENRTVSIVNKDGGFVRWWDPYTEGEMQEADGYFKIRRGGGIAPWSNRRSTVAFATKLMPPLGLNWIYRDFHIFNIWLALLCNDKEGAGSFTLVFDHAQEKLEEFKLLQEYAIQIDVEELEPAETELGEKLFEMLREYLRSGSNAKDPQIFQFKDGLLVTTSFLKDASTKIAGNPKVETLVKQLQKIGYTNGQPVTVKPASQGIQALSAKQWLSIGGSPWMTREKTFPAGAGARQASSPGAVAEGAKKVEVGKTAGAGDVRQVATATKSEVQGKAVGVAQSAASGAAQGEGKSAIANIAAASQPIVSGNISERIAARGLNGLMVSISLLHGLTLPLNALPIVAQRVIGLQQASENLLDEIKSAGESKSVNLFDDVKNTATASEVKPINIIGKPF